MTLAAATRELQNTLATLSFAAPVTHVYNPLDYASQNYGAYLSLAGSGPKRAVFLGMNPGPFGMAQTGVPFGDPGAARAFLRLTHAPDRPAQEHPKRPVLGFASPRGEVSGQRLWSLFAERFATREAFFAEYFVANYCPLCFLEASGRNRTPDKLPKDEREPLLEACDRHLLRIVLELRPTWVVGVGAFAAERARIVLASTSVAVTQILHPSPASPAANRGWAAQVEKQLQQCAGLWDC